MMDNNPAGRPPSIATIVINKVATTCIRYGTFLLFFFFSTCTISINVMRRILQEEVVCEHTGHPQFCHSPEKRLRNAST
jgi:hypothetical protein